MNKLKDRRREQIRQARRAPSDLVTTREANIRTGIPQRTIQRWAKENRIRSEKRGPKLLYVSVSDILRVAQEIKPGKKKAGR